MSIISAPEHLAFDKESLEEGVPTARSEIGFKGSVSAHRKQKFTAKGKEFLKATRRKNREKAFKTLIKKAQSLLKLCNSAETRLVDLEAGRDQ